MLLASGRVADQRRFGFASEPKLSPLRAGPTHRCACRPTGLPFVAPQLAALVGNALANFADGDLWWPYPELGATIEMRMVNPITGQQFLAAGPQSGYWLTKWMDDPSYSRYQASQGLRWLWLPTWWPGNSYRTPAVDGYRLEYRINGKQYPAW